MPLTTPTKASDTPVASVSPIFAKASFNLPVSVFVSSILSFNLSVFSAFSSIFFPKFVVNSLILVCISSIPENFRINCATGFSSINFAIASNAPTNF